MREAELREEAFVGVRLLDGVQILALDILDECHLRQLRVGCRAKDDGDGRESCDPCRAQTALARDEFVFPAANIAHGEGLKDTMPHNGFTQLLKCRLIEFTPWLKAIRDDCIHGQLCGFSRLCRRFRRLRGGGLFCRFWRACKGVFPKSKRTETASKSACLSFLHAS